METSDDSDVEESHQYTPELCAQEVTALFPDICLQSLASIAEPLGFVPQTVINHIIDLLESGKTYPKREQAAQALGKRKRDDSEQDDDLAETALQAKRLYAPKDREQPRLAFKDPAFVKHMIAGDFPFVPMKVIQHVLSKNNSLLFPTYLALNDIIEEAGEPISFKWAYKKRPSNMPPKYKEANIDESIRSADRSLEKERGEAELMEELKAARAARRHAKMEQQNFDEARSRGEIKECECCFGDFAENRLVHCNGGDIHFFCFQCALRNAEIQVGLSKHELECMSTEGCKAGFSRKERGNFLPPSLASALDRIEQAECLRLAGLPDLAHCPFCSYAEEYPPVAINKEFQCRKPDCMITSCRVCNLATHLPKTCEEAAEEDARDKGLVVRRQVEEAMSQALIRNCNKCNTPFIKEDGCNKMTCSKPGCRNVQCYVCSKSCDYSHFDRPERGGKVGNCPLFDNVAERHVREVEKAEEETKQKVLEENPGLEPELLNLSFSSNVKKDEDRRLERAVARHIPHGRPNGRPPRRDNGQQPQVPANGLRDDDEEPVWLGENAAGRWLQQPREIERLQQRLQRLQQLQQAQQAQEAQQAEQQAFQARLQAQQQAQQARLQALEALEAHEQAQQVRLQARQARHQAQQQAPQADHQAQQALQQAQGAQQLGQGLEAQQMQAFGAMKDHFRQPIVNAWQKFRNFTNGPVPLILAPGQAQPVALQPGPVEPHLQQGPLPPMPNPNP